METTLDIKSIQYINLLRFMTGVSAMDCFEYNNSMIFVIKPQLIKLALANNGEKIKQLSEKIRRRVKIVAFPKNKNTENVEKFILSITYPVRFKKITISGEEATINAGPETKARLIGRGKIRLIELNGIVKKYFSIKKILIR